MPVVHHMVLLKFQPDVPADKIDNLLQQLADLRHVLPGIRYFAAGPYRSPEGMNQGYTHGFLMTFDNPAARDAYLVHPQHEHIKQQVLPCLDAAIAFDFEADP